MSLLIKEVFVVDGEGNAPYKADVLVQNNVISAIGNLKGKHSSEIIDGLGNYLTPGFIDVNSTSDHYLTLFNGEGENNFGVQGVTTIIGGMCGASLAPIIYGSLESISKWTNLDNVNVNWHTVREFLNSLDKVKLKINFGTLVGHGTIRRAITGNEKRNLTIKELWVFKRLLNQALSEGAYGLSTGLGFISGRETPYEEIRELVGIIKKYDGVYATHLRNDKDKISESVEETIKIAKTSNVKTIISHFEPNLGFEKEYEEALTKIRDANLDNLYFDIHGHDSREISIYKLLPVWAQKENLETMFEILKNKDNYKKIVKDLKFLNPGDVTISHAPTQKFLEGKNLWQMMENYGLSAAESLLKVMDMTNMKATVFYKNINPELFKTLIKEKNALIGSSSNSTTEKSNPTFSKFLRTVMQSDLMPIETAVKKVTSEPAKIFSIKDRGVIKYGKKADLVVIGKNDYEAKEVIIGGKRLSKGSNAEILRHK